MPVKTLDEALNPFFWDKLTPRTQRVVQKHAIDIYNLLEKKASWAPLNCDMACKVWAQVFKKE